MYEGLYDKLWSRYGPEYYIEINVPDWQSKDYELYRGALDEFDSNLFKLVFRDPGCFYIVKIKAVESDLLEDIDLYQERIDEWSFFHFSKPVSPTLIKADDCSFSFSWDIEKYCGFDAVNKLKETVKYDVQYAEGHEVKPGLVSHFASDVGSATGYTSIGVYDTPLDQVTVSGLKPGHWYYARVLYKYDGVDYESSTLSLKTTARKPEPPHLPRVYNVFSTTYDGTDEAKVDALEVRWSTPECYNSPIVRYQVQFQEVYVIPTANDQTLRIENEQMLALQEGDYKVVDIDAADAKAGFLLEDSMAFAEREEKAAKDDYKAVQHGDSQSMPANDDRSMDSESKASIGGIIQKYTDAAVGSKHGENALVAGGRTGQSLPHADGGLSMFSPIYVKNPPKPDQDALYLDAVREEEEYLHVNGIIIGRLSREELMELDARKLRNFHRKMRQFEEDQVVHAVVEGQGKVVESKWNIIANPMPTKVKLKVPTKRSLEWRIRVRVRTEVGWSSFSPVLQLNATTHPSLFRASDPLALDTDTRPTTSLYCPSMTSRPSTQQGPTGESGQQSVSEFYHRKAK